PPSSLGTPAAGQTTATLSWVASVDPRTTGYEVLVNGGVAGTAALPTYPLTGLTCGTTYSVAVRAIGGGLTSAQVAGTVVTTVCPVAPSNDAFAAAQAIAGTSGTVAGSTVDASKQTGEPNHAGNAGGASVWY